MMKKFIRQKTLPTITNVVVRLNGESEESESGFILFIRVFTM